MILVALGSNISGPWGNPHQTVSRAIVEMQLHGITVTDHSTLIETAPMGPPNQPRYVNAVIIVRTAKSPDSLMRTLHAIERQAGRVRRLRWGPRTLDLDLLDYHGIRRKPPRKSIKQLTLPHPGISYRRFVLQPIDEVAPRWHHPLTLATAGFMLRKLYRLKQN